MSSNQVVVIDVFSDFLDCLSDRVVGCHFQFGFDGPEAGLHQRIVVDGEPDGVTTSGTYSPTLECSIGMGRAPVAIGEYCKVEIRGRELAARVVKPPFVRNGKACIEL